MLWNTFHPLPISVWPRSSEEKSSRWFLDNKSLASDQRELERSLVVPQDVNRKVEQVPLWVRVNHAEQETQGAVCVKYVRGRI